MPDKRTHRGPHPEDRRLFAAEHHPRLRSAVADLSWLLSRGYAQTSALKLVGDRYALRQRQRLAVMRSACSDQALRDRAARRAAPSDLSGRTLLIDGYNVLTTLEAALSGGVLLLGRDGCLRDLASMHGSYRKVAETAPALEFLGAALSGWAVADVLWYLDSPVSNSGRLKTLIRRTAEEHGWPWRVRLVLSPDALLARSEHLIATADSAVLDRCGPWLNLARHVVADHVPDAEWIDLTDP